jgi:phage shock protein A
MNTLSRIFNRVREQLAEIGESIVGDQARRELDDEIRDADTRLHEWRANLASFQANRLTTQERVDRAVASIQQREAQALAALRTGKANLAREVAAAIVQLEQARDDEQVLAAHLDERIAQMRQLIEQGENGLRRLQHQRDALRAAETVQRAQETIAGRQPGTAPLPQTAIASLLRARRDRTVPPADDERPEPSVDDTGLDARLEAAGIGERDTRAELVLERIGQRLAVAPRAGGRRRKQNPEQEPR